MGMEAFLSLVRLLPASLGEGRGMAYNCGTPHIPHEGPSAWHTVCAVRAQHPLSLRLEEVYQGCEVRQRLARARVCFHQPGARRTNMEMHPRDRREREGTGRGEENRGEERGGEER